MQRDADLGRAPDVDRTLLRAPTSRSEMAFIQIMTYTTSRRDELDAAKRQWVEDTDEVSRVRRRLLLRDRERQDHYVEVVFFDSYEDAMHNSRLPATVQLSKLCEQLCDGAFEFSNLDVVMDGF
jgi:hypothetical protein